MTQLSQLQLAETWLDGQWDRLWEKYEIENILSINLTFLEKKTAITVFQWQNTSVWWKHSLEATEVSH